MDSAAAAVPADSPDVRAAESIAATALAAIAQIAAPDSAAAIAPESSASAPLPAVPALAGYVLLPAELPPLPADVVSVCDTALRDSLVQLLQLIHPASRLLPRALPAFARLCNRLAHMELLGADLNGGRLDMYVPVSIPALHQYHRSESLKARAKFDSGSDSRGGLTMTVQTADRWMHEYRALHPESTLELSVSARIELLGSVEYAIAELLELSGNAARDHGQRSLSVVHLFLSIQSDAEQRLLCNYLRQPFEATVAGPIKSVRGHVELIATATPAVRAITAERMQRDTQDKTGGFPRHAPCLQATAEDFGPNEAHMRTLNAACWYHDAARVAEYAQMYARGELKSPVSAFFASFGIRALAFYGHARPTQLGADLSAPRAFFSFELWDCESALWWPFLAAVRPIARPVFDVLTAWSAMPLMRGQLEPARVDALESLAPLRMRTCKWTKPHQIPSFGPQQATAAHKEAQRAGAGTVEGTTNNNAADAHPSSSEAGFGPSPVAVTDDEYAVRRQRFRAQLSAALLLSSFPRFGASLFYANHPLRVRVAFTAAAVDVASAAVGLPTLPTVLLDLIGQYEPTDLLYIAHATRAQATDAQAAALDALMQTLPDGLGDTAAASVYEAEAHRWYVANEDAVDE